MRLFINTFSLEDILQWNVPYIMTTFNINSELAYISIYSYLLPLLSDIIHSCPLPSDLPSSFGKKSFFTSLNPYCAVWLTLHSMDETIGHKPCLSRRFEYHCMVWLSLCFPLLWKYTYPTQGLLLQAGYYKSLK